jgi:hypothetical protein
MMMINLTEVTFMQYLHEKLFVDGLYIGLASIVVVFIATSLFMYYVYPMFIPAKRRQKAKKNCLRVMNVIVKLLFFGITFNLIFLFLKYLEV